MFVRGWLKAGRRCGAALCLPRRVRPWPPVAASCESRFISSAAASTRGRTDGDRIEQEDEEEDLSDAFLPSLASTAAAAVAAGSSSSSLAPSAAAASPTHMHGHPIALTPLPCPAPSFHDLRVASPLCHRLASLNYHRPSIIQTAAIPFMLPAAASASAAFPLPDLLISDLPGTGKTLAFLLPLLSSLSPYLHSLQCVIVAPTRELSTQLQLTLQQLTAGGSKARQRNPLRVDLAVGHVNPSMLSSLTRPQSRQQPKLTAAPGVDVPRQFMREMDEEMGVGGEGGRGGLGGIGGGSPVPQVLIGTADCLHELLVKRGLLQLAHLSRIVCDEVDALLNKPDAQRLIAGIIQLRDRRAPTEPGLPSSTTSSAAASAAAADAAAPSATQVVFVSSTLTPPVLHFAAAHLARRRLLVTAASVPSECHRRHRLLLSSSSSAAPSSTSALSPLLSPTQARRRRQQQMLQLHPHVSHHFARMPAQVSGKERGEMLLQLCRAILSSAERQHTAPPAVGRVRRPHPIRRLSASAPSKLEMGVASLLPVPPHAAPPLTIAVVFSAAATAFPLLPLFSSHFRIALLTSLSSRSERRDALSAHSPPEVLLCESRLLRGLHLPALAVVVNWDVPRSSVEYYHRAGRVGRKGGVRRDGRVVTLVRDGTGEEEAVDATVRAMGGRGATQLVVRGEKLFERGRKRLRRGGADEAQQADTERQKAERQLRPIRFIDSLLGTERGGSRLQAARAVAE